jgi:tetratricopeptide (TPR) repeat protein
VSTLKEALALSSEGSLDYYLISGEIAFLEGKPNAAQLSYQKAYQIDPNDFQVNNALALFYMDLEEVAPQYADYKKALSHAQRAFELSNLELAKQNLAIAHLFNKNYNQTISLLSSSDFNKEPYLAYWIGLAYAGKDDVINAKTYLQTAVNGGADVPQSVYDYLNSN